MTRITKGEHPPTEPALGYRPKVLYRYADGAKSFNGSDVMAWLDLGRAISSCFGSVAQRTRSKRDGWPLYAVLRVVEVVNGKNGRVVWGPKKINLSERNGS